VVTNVEHHTGKRQRTRPSWRRDRPPGARPTGYRDRVRSGDRPGRVIFLNGTSSAGKTTLARAVQDESETPVVHWGIDTMFSLVPPNWGGSCCAGIAPHGPEAGGTRGPRARPSRSFGDPPAG
jgi:chloramphenicol 3-O-phosphotransferase